MARLYSYSKLPTLRRALRERYDAVGRDVVFMLPSMANEDLLLDALSTEDGYFATRPEVWSWAALYRAVVPPRSLRRQVDPPDHRLILDFILKRTLGDLDDKGVAVPRGVRRSGFLDLLSSSIRELLLEDISPDRLLPEVSDGASLDSRELLHRLYTDYLLYLEENGLADNAQLPILTRQACGDDCGRLRGRTTLWVGFLSLTGAQLKLVRVLERRGVKLEFFVPDTGLERFYDAANQLGLERTDSGDCGGRLVTLLAQDRYGQFEGVARGIALARAGAGGLFEATGASDVSEMLSDVGILTNSADLPLMASALEKYGIASESRAERPVSDSILIRTARQAWEAYVQDWPTRKTLHLLSAPIFGLVELDEERVASRMPEGWRAWRELAGGMEGVGEALDRLKTFCAFLNDPAGHTGEELLRSLLELAGGDEWETRLSREVADDLPLDFAVREIASSRMEVEQKLELLRELQPAIGEAGEVRFAGREAMAFITGWSREATIALSQPLSGAVRLYDSPPPVMMSHKLWIMTDVTPSRYPGTASDDSLLGADVRDEVNDAAEQFVHLPTLHEKREQKEALFRRMLAVGEELTILARPIGDSQGRPQGDSPFLMSLLADRSAGWERTGEILCTDSCLPGEGDPLLDRREVTADSGRIHRGRFPRIGVLQKDGLEEKTRVRLSALDAWLDCPFLYWCGSMGIEPPRDATSAVDALERGNLLHELWQRVWSGWAPEERVSLLAVAKREWDAMLEERRRAGSRIADPRATAVVAALSRMIRKVARRMDEVEESARENGLIREGVLPERALPDFEGESAVFVGRADRVDLWRDAGAVLVDYKLGKSERYRKSLQLAAYAYLMEAAGEGPIAGFGFLGHRDARFRGNWSEETLLAYKGSRRTSWDVPPEPAVAEAAQAIAALDAGICGGRFEANYDSDRCASCPYGIICRRAERRGAMEEETDESDE